MLLGGEAGLRCGEMMALEWSDVDLRQAAAVRAAVRLEGPGHGTKGGRVRYVPMTDRLAAALQEHRHLRGTRVLCRAGRRAADAEDGAGASSTRRSVGGRARPGVHILRHTFCSHLAMRGAPARAIQELAGHQDLATTQRYMHLSPAAIEGAIRLLDASRTGAPRWQHVGNGIYRDR